jgi:DNA-binding transcriptional ArsR family regulator
MPATDTFSALSNPVRRRILEMLRERPMSAGEISENFDLNRPAVSEHLQVLRLAGLVSEEVRGRHRVYHLRAKGLTEVSDWLVPFRQFWKQRLSALDKAMKEEPT